MRGQFSLRPRDAQLKEGERLCVWLEREFVLLSLRK
jgi:hypothetical protein